jgi:5-methylcytosine-specific restriction enzyme subunit McrC
MMGVELQAGSRTGAAPGFLFDMNKFFQRLLSRFLREHVEDATIKDERGIRRIYSYLPGANPKERKPPRPRPDFALLRRNQLVAFLDAKYYEMWEQRPPASLLYQLSVYAMSSPERVSVMLYPTMSESASDEIIEARPPFANGGAPAFVIVRPVPLQKLSALVTDQSAGAREERRRFAQEMVSLDTRQRPRSQR